MTAWPEKFWYQKHWLRWVLWPVSLVYAGIIKIRRWYLENFLQIPAKTPVIIVGNITVGGVGKTPLVIALAHKLMEQGLKVGIVSRGYGASVNRHPYQVSVHDSPSLVGDEPLLIALKTGCPVVIAAKRVEAVAFLEQSHQVQIIISDDGLQHYAMGRTLEISVIDDSRGLGNGFCLPAGPLREPASRLKEVDFLIINKPYSKNGISKIPEDSWSNAYFMTLKPGTIRQLATEHIVTDFKDKGTIAALAAIGNPDRFFNTLHACGLKFQPYSYPDHYVFKPEDFNKPEETFLMTEKDAVKCKAFARNNMYYLPVEAILCEQFWEKLMSHERLQGVLQ